MTVWDLILNFWYLLAAIITVIVFIIACTPKIVSAREKIRHYHYTENFLISINEYSIDWGHRICFQIFNFKIVYPIQKKIKLLNIPINSSYGISIKSQTTLTCPLDDKFQKPYEKLDTKEIFLFSDVDYGICPKFWQEIMNSDYIIEITTPVGEEIHNRVTCERQDNTLVITNNTTEVVCSYPCSIPSGYQIKDLEPLKNYIQSFSSKEDGSQVSLTLQNIEPRPGENKITILIIPIPPEPTVSQGSAA